MVVTEPGSFTVVIAVLENMWSGMLVSPAGNVNEVSLWQLANAEEPISVTVSGITIFFSPVFIKAFSPQGRLTVICDAGHGAPMKYFNLPLCKLSLQSGKFISLREWLLIHPFRSPQRILQKVRNSHQK